MSTSKFLPPVPGTEHFFRPLTLDDIDDDETLQEAHARIRIRREKELKEAKNKLYELELKDKKRNKECPIMNFIF